MIRLKQCSINPHHWYSGHIPDCPWCRAVQENKSDPFPGPFIGPPVPRQTVRHAQPGYGDNNTNPANPRLAVTPNPSSRTWLTIGAIVAIVLVIIIAGVFSNGSSAASAVSVSHISTTPSPVITALATHSPITQSPTPAYQGFRSISASIKKFVLKAGEDVSVEGVVSGTRDPVIISVYSLNDTSGIDFDRILLSSLVTQSDDHSFRYRFLVDSKIFPAGSYVILMKLPSEESTKLQFLVDE
jgi:hypothetical protein